MTNTKSENINLWIKSKQKISKKYLPVLEDMFKTKQQYFMKELNDLVEVPIYDKEQMNKMERSIEKAKLIFRFKEALTNELGELFVKSRRLEDEIRKNLLGNWI